MYRCVGFPLAFQCWFYECCPYADNHLTDRVGDGVPRILNWFVKHRPAYKEVKSAFFDIRQEQCCVILRRQFLKKTILQLLDFKSMDAVVNSVDLPSTSKQECSNLISDNELTLLRSDVKMLTKKACSMEKFMKSSFELIFRALDIKNEPKNELNWSEISDAEISKFTQPDKSVATIDETGLVCDNVRKVDANASDNVKGIEANMVAASIMLDETPAIPLRLRKPATVGESSFLSKFYSGCGKFEGQSFSRIENAQPSKRVLYIKHPFVKSITEQTDDMKVTLQFNRFVARSLSVKQMDCGVFVVVFAEYLFDGLEIYNNLDDIDAIRIRYDVLL
ncbi:hypothetical protein FXO37_09478 [Capsicum annuum]|nr:hypothetical protein FXO37_09478 [Capsicum annuum]